MSLSRIVKAAGVAAVVALGAGAALAQDGKIEVGMLDCRLTDSTNLVIVSGRSFDCIYHPAGGNAPDEFYTAKIDKLGIDLSDNDDEHVRWVVFAPSTSLKPGNLKGIYVGASAEATLGKGVGGRVLVGGFEDAISLQPASVSTTEGVGIAAGIEEMKLSFEGTL